MDFNEEAPINLKLYSYWRSSSSYRVRIALYFKDLGFEYIPVHLLKEGGEQHHENYQKVNPIRQVPCLTHVDVVLTQSMAIIQFLDEMWPEPRLFPKDPYKKAKVIEVCEIINSGIQPIQNLSVLKALVHDYNLSDEQKVKWSHDWIVKGFTGLEKILENTFDRYCFGNELSAADCFLVPQVYNANRFNVDMGRFPIISKINDECLKMSCFEKALPENQPDADT